jgi:hypothetical protein
MTGTYPLVPLLPAGPTGPASFLHEVKIIAQANKPVAIGRILSAFIFFFLVSVYCAKMRCPVKFLVTHQWKELA